MKQRNKSREAALLEAMAWVAGLTVLLCVFRPDLRHLAPTVLVPLGIIFGAFAAFWLGSKPIKGNAHMHAFETAASFTTSQSGQINEFEPPIFGAAMSSLHFVPEPTISDRLREIGSFQFEKVIELIFQDLGFSVKPSADENQHFDMDGGIDLVIESTAHKYAVQYKHWRKWSVDGRQIREFLATMTEARMQKGIFITLAGCSDETKQWAATHGIQILGEPEIIEMLVESGLIYDQRISELLSEEGKYCSK